MPSTREAAWIAGQVVHADGGASLMDTVLPLEMQQPELTPPQREPEPVLEGV
jgi:hypothetical protein